MHVLSNTVLEEVSFLGCLDFISSSFRIYNLNLDALTKTFHVMGPLILRKSWLPLRFLSVLPLSVWKIKETLFIE